MKMKQRIQKMLQRRKRRKQNLIKRNRNRMLTMKHILEIFQRIISAMRVAMAELRVKIF